MSTRGTNARPAGFCLGSYSEEENYSEETGDLAQCSYCGRMFQGKKSGNFLRIPRHKANPSPYTGLRQMVEAHKRKVPPGRSQEADDKGL